MSYITAQGARSRRHRYFRELQAFFFPAIAAILTACVIYIATISRSGRSDWHNTYLVLLAIGCVPLVASAVLAGLRRHESAMVTSILITSGLFSVAVSVLSALRIPVSYQGLLYCFPAIILVMAYANSRFQRTIGSKVALTDFVDADALAAEFGDISVVRDPAAEIPDIEILLIDPHEHHTEKWSSLLANCYLRGIEIVPWASFREVRSGRLDVPSFEISHLAYSPSQLFYARVKRTLDILTVLVSLPVTLPIAALVAAYIGLRNGMPVIFVQVRRGYGGRRFRMYKFRTMYKGTEGGSTSVRDKRIIPGCRMIRKLRFDEIPQLYNILRGDMSLIGPRPVAEYVARSSAQVQPKYELRSLVPPGITGWAQVHSGYAGTVDEEIEKLSYDLYYIKHLSFDLDVLILFKTARTVLFGSGAR
ncbi:sugar transferase [Pelagibacterium nitratireducens]|uniref:Sugar transferase n=1 Tax=Pelagibacterium nitratireducens TaxID=1046114 RepID=A0ABZ2I063_9HYPH